MAAFLIPLFIVLSVFAFTAGDELLKGFDLSLPSFQFFPEAKEQKAKTSTAPSGSIQGAPSTPTAPSFVLNTEITAGPLEGASIKNTNKVTFAFAGSVSPANTEGRITFQTRVLGVDKDWVSTSAKQRTVTLPAGNNEYVFQVRSKLATVLDSTPEERTFRIEISPYFDKMTVTLKRATSSSPFLATLTPRLSAGETLTITGWTLQSNTGSFSLGYGTQHILSNNNSFTQPIVVSKGERVLVSGRASPFGTGGNFKPNICMGWLKEFYTFPLSIPGSCPDRLKVENVSFLNPSCQDFLLKKVNATRCEVPDYSQNTVVAGDSECVSFINSNLTYDACVAKHSNDANFLDNEWQVLTNRSFGHPLHDTVLLLDEQGLLVDDYIY